MGLIAAWTSFLKRSIGGLYSRLNTSATEKVEVGERAVALASVFTHLLPDDVKHYFQEIARVAKRGARTISAYFLFNDEARSHIRAGGIRFPLRKVRSLRKQVYRVNDPDVPEKAVAYEEDWIRALHLRNRLSIVEITYGNWSGRTDLVGCLEDTIIAVKG